MKDLLNKYCKFFDIVRTEHEKRGMASGHDFDHAVSVANLAAIFCESLELKEFAWVAGLCHNADRIIAIDRQTPRRDIAKEDVAVLVREWLKSTDLLLSVPRIVEAVQEHGEPNNPNDDKIIVALKDADRVVNARLDVVIRSGQFRSNLPVFDPILLLNDTRGKYNSRLTIVADLMDCLDWGNLEDARFGVRTAGAKKMIVERVALLKQFLEMIVEQRREEGLVPYPILSE